MDRGCSETSDTRQVDVCSEEPCEDYIRRCGNLATKVERNLDDAQCHASMYASFSETYFLICGNISGHLSKCLKMLRM